MTLPPRMKFGIFLAPFHQLGEDPTLALERDLDALRTLWQQRVAALESAAAEPQSLREIEAALAVPHLSAHSRLALRERFSTVAQNVHAAKTAPRAAPDAASEEEDGYLSLMATAWRSAGTSG